MASRRGLALLVALLLILAACTQSALSPRNRLHRRCIRTYTDHRTVDHDSASAHNDPRRRKGGDTKSGPGLAGADDRVRADPDGRRALGIGRFA